MPADLRKYVPAFIKPLLRFIRYPNERKKVFRELAIRKEQNARLKAQFDPHSKKLVIFAIAGSDWATGKDKISGGIISIVSLCEQTAGFKAIHGSETILCTMTGEHLLLRHTQFDNHTDVFRLGQVPAFFREAEEVILHLPEFLCDHFLRHTDLRTMNWLKTRKALHINILNQNILLMPPVETIDTLKNLAQKVTSTTAHQRYCSPGYRAQFGIPIHKFSAWVSPEQYKYVDFANKENLIIVSPDQKPIKDEVLGKLSTLKNLKLQDIGGLTYAQFKEVISRAKWALTFGEGLDGYIIEPIFSGAIGFAVFNEDFFTPDFKELKTVYRSFEELLERITADIQRLDNEVKFDAYQQQQFDLCARYYSFDQYRRNIEAFYKGEYTLP